ncbi:MAG TPA: magnesium transporter CorA family protein, partial [Candidatus Omnitrophota bacterium]|nr:magnesium transporter CorA family protein [Candidatus Omnitrophota bacterium]
MRDIFLYDPEKGLSTDIKTEEIAQALQNPRSLIWIDMTDVDDQDIDLLTSVFGLHELTVEDAIMANSRSKIEKFKDYIFLILFSLEKGNGGSLSQAKVKTTELDCCLGRNYLITFHSGHLPQVSVCKDRIKRQSPMIMNGADMLLYSILDSCVDSYFPVIDEFDRMVDEMSDELFKDPTQKTLHKIYELKNEVMYLRRTIGPQADVINLMARGDFEFIPPPNIIYFRNIYDNLVRLNDIVGTSRDIITGAMEAYVSVVSNRLNEIMKTL